MCSVKYFKEIIWKKITYYRRVKNAMQCALYGNLIKAQLDIMHNYLPHNTLYRYIIKNISDIFVVENNHIFAISD